MTDKPEDTTYGIVTWNPHKKRWYRRLTDEGGYKVIEMVGKLNGDLCNVVRMARHLQGDERDDANIIAQFAIEYAVANYIEGKGMTLWSYCQLCMISNIRNVRDKYNKRSQPYSLIVYKGFIAGHDNACDSDVCDVLAEQELVENAKKQVDDLIEGSQLTKLQREAIKSRFRFPGSLTPPQLAKHRGVVPQTVSANAVAAVERIKRYLTNKGVAVA